MTNPPTLIAMAGMPGSGKSTVALALGRLLANPILDKDVILSGILETGITGHETQPVAYGVLFALARAFVRDQRLSVILDSPLAFASTLVMVKEIADDAEATLIRILCLADRDVRNRRVAERTAQRSQLVQESRTVGTGRGRFLHLPEDTLLVATERPLTDVMADLETTVRERMELES